MAKFSYFKDREMVRKKWKELGGTGFRVFEQYPPEVIQKRQLLVPKMKEARRLGKRAYLAFDNSILTEPRCVPRNTAVMN